MCLFSILVVICLDSGEEQMDENDVERNIFTKDVDNEISFLSFFFTFSFEIIKLLYFIETKRNCFLI